MGIQTARKRKNRFGVCKEVRDVTFPSKECIGIFYWRYKTAKTKLTYITMIKTVMLMGNLCLRIINMMAFFFRKLLLEVAYTIQRLKQY